MDIASLSTAMATQSLQSAISMNVLKKAMNHEEMSVNFITDALESIDTTKDVPSFGHAFDIKA